MKKKLKHRLFFLSKTPLIILMRTFIFLCVINVFSFTHNNVLSQNSKIKIEEDKTLTIDEVFYIIMDQTDYNFIYEAGIFKDFPTVKVKKGIISTNNLLQKSLSHKDLNIIVTTNNTILIKPKKKRMGLFKSQQQVSGIVTDQKGVPISGVTILIKGTMKGTATDFDGSYTITVPNPENVLVFSSVVFEPKEILVGNQTVINVQLNPLVTPLDELVLVGYGNVKKRDLTGSVGTVDVANITNQAPTINLDYALQGQIAGVQVSGQTGQPGAAAKVRIRGTTSLIGSNQPLYVIDGIPVVPDSNIPDGGTEGFSLGSTLNDNLGLSTPLANINSADIQSISVLKDASAAAIYGSRAANGVIIIETKRGSSSGAPIFNVNYSTSIQSANTLDVLNATQFKQVWTTAVENSSLTNAYTVSVLDGTYFGDADTNWENEVSPSTPITTNFNLSVLGGAGKTKYSTSLGINKQNGVYENTGFDRYSFNLNLDTKVNTFWEFGSSLNISFADQSAADFELIQLTYKFRPDLPVYNEEGDFSTSSQYFNENPVANSNILLKNKTTLLLGSFYAQLNLSKGLHAKSFLSVNLNNGKQNAFYPGNTTRGGMELFWLAFNFPIVEGDGFAQESRSTSSNVLWQNTLTYDKVINKHNINTVLGASFERSKSSFNKAWGEGFSNNVLTNVSSATAFTNGSAAEESSGLASYFGRVNYGYDNKYLLTISGRVDGSSKFAVENKYAFFPAAAVAWRISEESFLSSSTFVNDLKLRMSLGRTGQQDFNPYQWRTLYGNSNYGANPSIIISQLGNDRLKWETTDQFDIGLDFTLFKGILSGTLGYYTKNTKDALFTTLVPESVGSTSVIANIGNTRNAGVELELNANIIQTDDFVWNLALNISQNKNKLTKISDDFLGDDGYLIGFPGGGRLKVGSPIGLIYGHVSEGLFQNQEEIDALNTGSSTGFYQDDETAPGDIKFKDITGPEGVPDGVITNLDRQAIGDTQPDFFGGFNSTWSYKGFTISTFFTYSLGNDLIADNLTDDVNFSSPAGGENKVTSVLNAWTPENTSSSIPRIVYGDPNRNNRTSSHFLYDASYLRLKTVNLRYDFPSEMIKKNKFLNSLSIYITAQNLITITNYPGADPETSNNNNNDINTGFDTSRFPIAKVFTAGISIGF